MLINTASFCYVKAAIFNFEFAVSWERFGTENLWGHGTGVKIQTFSKDVIKVKVSKDFMVSDLNQLSLNLIENGYQNWQAHFGNKGTVSLFCYVLF